MNKKDDLASKKDGISGTQVRVRVRVRVRII
jgi:hypothetical protein